MKLTIPRFLIIAGISTAIATDLQCQVDFESEAIASWEEISRQCNSANGTCTLSTAWNSESYPETKYSFSSNGRGFAIQASIAGDRITTELFLKSPANYVARLQKSSTEEWVLLSLQREPGFHDRLEIERTIRLFSPISLMRTTAAELWNKPYFNVKHIGETNDGLYQVDFESFHEREADKDEVGIGEYNWIQQGSIIFDPKRSWVVTKAELDGKDIEGKKFKMLIEHFFADDPHQLLPVATKNTLEKSDGIWTAKTQFEWNDNIPKDSDLMLAAYGIQEPDGFKKQSFPWFLVAAAVSCGVIALGYFMIRKSRK